MTRGLLFYLQLGFTLLVCAFLVVPVAMSITAGFTANFMDGVRSGLTVRWLLQVWDLYSDTMGRSLGIALACLAVTLIAGVPAAYTLFKWKGRVARILEELLVMPVAVPGLATALGLILAYGRFGAFRQSWVFILVGHAVFTLPFMVRSVLAVLGSMDVRTLEEGAASLGAGFWTRFFTVIIPNAMPGILAGSMMVVTLSVGEFNLTWMLHTPLTKTLPVGLADSYASMRLEIGSAYTVVFFIMIMPLLLGLQWASRGPQKQGKAKKEVADNASAAIDLAA
jgi:putative spermidine/putrescine transport system permease protein